MREQDFQVVHNIVDSRDGSVIKSFAFKYVMTHTKQDDVFIASMTDEYGTSVTMRNPPHSKESIYKTLRQWMVADAQAKIDAWLEIYKKGGEL